MARRSMSEDSLRIDAEAIKTANIHIAVDSINGAGGAVSLCYSRNSVSMVRGA